jgi:hypothetical protein
MAIRSLIVVSLMVGAWLSGAAQAQDAVVPAVTTEARVNVDRLPLDLQRLERRLRQSVERQDWDGFRLRYTVEVYGKAPKIQFFDPKDVLPGGPIPYGAPTHREMIEVMTPKEYRAPVMDFSALMRWLEGKLK